MESSISHNVRSVLRVTDVVTAATYNYVCASLVLYLCLDMNSRALDRRSYDSHVQLRLDMNSRTLDRTRCIPKVSASPGADTKNFEVKDYLLNSIHHLISCQCAIYMMLLINMKFAVQT